MNEFEIVSTNISEKKGTVKQPVKTVRVSEKGIDGDAHSGEWNRQISLLAIESIEKFEKQTGRHINYGEFAENLTTKGISLIDTNPLDLLKIDDVILEITQLGKKCHASQCNIYKQAGKCIMPEEGIFARVIQSGWINAGMKGEWQPKIFNIKVITLSDRASKGIYEDISGPTVTKKIQDFFSSIKRKVNIENIIITDDEVQLLYLLDESVKADTDYIFTTGGTGIGARDITVDIVKKMCDKEIPGIMDFIRYKYGEKNPSALVSRSIAAVKKRTAIFTLPGNVKAVDEYLTEIQKNLLHITYMLKGLDIHS